MTLGEASAGFLEHLKSTKRDERCEAATIAQTLELLNTFLPEATLEDLTRDRLRDFVARWYVEQTSHQPSPRDLLNSLDAFLNWVDVNAGCAIQGDCSAMIAELNDSLPRALEITATLSSQLGSGGAFGFPEFLTSFEEGGRSQYDFDVGGSAATLEGFFRIARIVGSSIEAEELISEETVFPVTFPAAAAVALEIGYIVNLELIRTGDGWQIVACGFAYPPGTAF